MTHEQFIVFCYQSVLRRTPDDIGFSYFLQRLNQQECSREQVLMEFLTSPEYEQQRASEGTEAFPSGHFYSALPSAEDRAAALAALPDARRRRELPGIELNLPAQVAFLRSLQPYLVDCPFPEEQTPDHRYYFLNPSYSFGDGLLLQAMLRRFRPRMIVEVGSGYSSALMLDVNDLYFGGRAECTFIEPYPDLLRSFLRDGDRAHVIPQKLQDVDLNIFSQLQTNDILFIDSTHVAKLGSDVLRIVFEILPRLAPGVVVHFHDIFWPFEYPEPWIREGRAWNEAYLLRAFLQFNPSFTILLFSNLVAHEDYEWLQTRVPRFYRNRGGNMWLQRRA